MHFDLQSFPRSKTNFVSGKTIYAQNHHLKRGFFVTESQFYVYFWATSLKPKRAKIDLASAVFK
jgi:hypothetical protein